MSMLKVRVLVEIEVMASGTGTEDPGRMVTRLKSDLLVAGSFWSVDERWDVEMK